jgi:putative SOS response-associated peptidase YedK
MIAPAEPGLAHGGSTAILLFMCGRYFRQSDKQAIAEHFAGDVHDFELHDGYNIAPPSTQPIIRTNRESGEHEVAMMRWGLILYWSKDTSGSAVGNARNDSPKLPAVAEPQPC